MTTMVVIIGIALQRFFQLHSAPYRQEGLNFYFQWVIVKVGQIIKGNGFISLAILVVPLLLIVSIVLALIYHLLGSVGYFIVNLALFWLCIEAHDLRKNPLPYKDFFDWFAVTYRELFAPLFWYVVLGPVILVLYVALGDMVRYLERSQKDTSNELINSAAKLRAILDWLPTRILGITYALVGHFKSVFILLKQQLLSNPLKNNQPEQLATWAFAALQPQPGAIEIEPLKEEVISLIERALLIWVIVLILLTVSSWLG